MLLLLRLLILTVWTWSHQLNTIILRKSILTCMSLNCSCSVMHCDIIMCLISNERRENALDNEAYSLIKPLRGKEDISLIKRVAFFLGQHCIISFIFVSFRSTCSTSTPDDRPIPLDLKVQSFPGKLYHHRVAAMNKPLYQGTVSNFL